MMKCMQCCDGVYDSRFEPDFVRGHGWLGGRNDVMWKAMVVVGGREKWMKKIYRIIENGVNKVRDEVIMSW